MIRSKNAVERANNYKQVDRRLQKHGKFYFYKEPPSLSIGKIIENILSDLGL